MNRYRERARLPRWLTGMVEHHLNLERFQTRGRTRVVSVLGPVDVPGHRRELSTIFI